MQYHLHITINVYRRNPMVLSENNSFHVVYYINNIFLYPTINYYLMKLLTIKHIIDKWEAIPMRLKNIRYIMLYKINY